MNGNGVFVHEEQVICLMKLVLGPIIPKVKMVYWMWLDMTLLSARIASHVAREATWSLAGSIKAKVDLSLLMSRFRMGLGLASLVALNQVHSLEACPTTPESVIHE